MLRAVLGATSVSVHWWACAVLVWTLVRTLLLLALLLLLLLGLLVGRIQRGVGSSRRVAALTVLEGAGDGFI